LHQDDGKHHYGATIYESHGHSSGSPLATVLGSVCGLFGSSLKPEATIPRISSASGIGSLDIQYFKENSMKEEMISRIKQLDNQQLLDEIGLGADAFQEGVFKLYLAEADARCLEVDPERLKIIKEEEKKEKTIKIKAKIQLGVGIFLLLNIGGLFFYGGDGNMRVPPLILIPLALIAVFLITKSLKKTSKPFMRIWQWIFIAIFSIGLAFLFASSWVGWGEGLFGAFLLFLVGTVILSFILMAFVSLVLLFIDKKRKKID
jgi:hypothetical protein